MVFTVNTQHCPVGNSRISSLRSGEMDGTMGRSVIFVFLISIMSDLSEIINTAPLNETDQSIFPNETTATEQSSVSTNSTVTESETETETSNGLGAGAIVGLVVAVICIIALFAFAFFMLFGNLRILQKDMYIDRVSSSPTLRDSLRRLIDTQDVSDLNGLKKETAKIEAMQRGKKKGYLSPAMLEYLYKIPDVSAEKAEEKRGVMVTVAQCRVPKVKIRKDTQVILTEKGSERNCLHMNWLADYFGQLMFLCQAPTPKQFVDHWMAIWQEKVGVVVWLGELDEKKTSKIDPYIPMVQSKTMTCGPFSISNNGVATTEHKEHTTYLVSVRRSSETRQLIFVHIHVWPDNVMPENVPLLADVVAFVLMHQRKQSKLHAPLPAVLAHCSLGLQRSAAFFAVYIGNQMWLQSKRINVMGILRYIRRHRWKAFGMGNPFLQLRIIYRTLEVIAERYPDAKAGPSFRIPPTVTKHDLIAKRKSDSNQKSIVGKSVRKAESEKSPSTPPTPTPIGNQDLRKFDTDADASISTDPMSQARLTKFVKSGI